MAVKQEWVELAEALTPKLIEKVVYPKRFINVVADEDAFHGWRTEPAGDIDQLPAIIFDKGDSFTLDFGDHLVGYLSMSIKWIGSPQDAPLRLKLIFGEMPCEIGEDFDDYQGWLSRSWLQEEMVYVDVLPGTVKLPLLLHRLAAGLEQAGASPSGSDLCSEARLGAGPGAAV